MAKKEAPTHDKTPAPASNFLHQIIDNDVKAQKNGGRVVTRFPPEPNGYLHIGHSKSICLNFGLAQEFGGQCNLRFDDTNPETEDTEYVDSIMADVRWLGFDWGTNLFYASDYFEKIYEAAERLIRDGKAYVDSQNEEQVRECRGDFTTPGKDSPYRNRSVEENLDLFRRMRAGEFEDGAHTLRAKIDMKSPNMNMRDPLLYRIKKVNHHRTGAKWCIYPMYDFAHPLSDAVEDVTHSICTLEFQDHRPFYDWTVANAPQGTGTPHQYEFARLNLSYLVMSKRKLLQLVKEGLVSGWDDPRMPTISGIRRRGYTPASIRNFAKRIGVAKANGTIDLEMLEQTVKEDLDAVSHRAMAVLDPIKLVIENYPDEGQEIVAPAHPKKPELGNRTLTFTKELYIDRKDFEENPPDDYFRLGPGRRVRLRFAYVVECKSFEKDASGRVTKIVCSYLPETLGGKPPADGKKVKGIIHWVSASKSIPAEVRIYGRLFTVPNPEVAPEGKDFKANMNPNSLTIVKDARLESGLANASVEHRYQFERTGYFCVDSKDSKPGALVFNMIVDL